MAAETQAAAETGQSANGAGPVPAAEECDDCATSSERFMGALGIAAALGLAFIGIDLVTGGALSRVLFGRGEADDAAG